MTSKDFYNLLNRSPLTRVPSCIISPITTYVSSALNGKAVVLKYRDIIIAVYDYKRMYIFKYHNHEAQRALECYHSRRSTLPYRPIYFYRRKDKIVDPHEGKPVNYDTYAKFGFKFHVWLYLGSLINKTSLNN